MFLILSLPSALNLQIVQIQSISQKIITKNHKFPQKMLFKATPKTPEKKTLEKKRCHFFSPRQIAVTTNWTILLLDQSIEEKKGWGSKVIMRQHEQILSKEIIECFLSLSRNLIARNVGTMGCVEVNSIGIYPVLLLL